MKISAGRMSLFKSSTGWIFFGVFVFLVVVLGVYAAHCGNDVCGYVFLLPAFPWVVLLEHIGLLAHAPRLLYAAFVMNLVVVYVFGLLVKTLFKRFRRRY